MNNHCTRSLLETVMIHFLPTQEMKIDLKTYNIMHNVFFNWDSLQYNVYVLLIKGKFTLEIQ